MINIPVYCSGVLDLIMDDMELEEWQGGLLQTAFVVCYSVSAPVFGYLGDRYSRKWLMVIGIFLWGTMSLTGTFMPVRSMRIAQSDI